MVREGNEELFRDDEGDTRRSKVRDVRKWCEMFGGQENCILRMHALSGVRVWHSMPSIGVLQYSFAPW